MPELGGGGGARLFRQCPKKKLFFLFWLNNKRHKFYLNEIKKNLKLPITVVTDHETHRHFSQFAGVTYIIIKQQTNNFRYYRGKILPWYNMERAKAYDHSLYDTTILLDCDYLCYTNNLLEYIKTEYDFLIVCDNSLSVIKSPIKGDRIFLARSW